MLDIIPLLKICVKGISEIGLKTRNELLVVNLKMDAICHLECSVACRSPVCRSMLAQLGWCYIASCNFECQIYSLICLLPEMLSAMDYGCVFLYGRGRNWLFGDRQYTVSRQS